MIHPSNNILKAIVKILEKLSGNLNSFAYSHQKAREGPILHILS